MKYNINGIIKFNNEKDFILYCLSKGYESKGCGSENERKELHKKPRFKQLCGPCYDGKNSVRYETWDVYEMLSR